LQSATTQQLYNVAATPVSNSRSNSTSNNNNNNNNNNERLTMTTAIWIQLYIGPDKIGAEPVCVLNFSGNVFQLKVEVQLIHSPLLDQCDIALITIYQPGTTVPARNGTERIDANTMVSACPQSTYAKPLLAVMVSQEQQPQPFATPRPKRHEVLYLVPASIGKDPKEEAEPKGSPSSDEGMEEGLNRVAASPSMRVSSNSLSIEFVVDLYKITKLDKLDEKFSNAAEYVHNNWHRKRYPVAKTGVFKNERWLTGIVCSALNLVLRADGGLVALHQGCIGSGSTHSDISVSVVGPKPSPPLLVCEGNQDSSNTVRETVKGQLFNELVRHRRIFAGGSEQKDFRPVLLMALNTAYISLELAFPTTKKGNLKNEGWITPEAKVDGDVVFFSVQIAFIRIDDDTEGPTKLAQLFCFIESALKKLRDMNDYKRDQWKTPWVGTRTVATALKRGGQRDSC
jgi:hypothetical protein